MNNNLHMYIYTTDLYIQNTEWRRKRIGGTPISLSSVQTSKPGGHEREDSICVYMSRYTRIPFHVYSNVGFGLRDSSTVGL